MLCAFVSPFRQDRERARTLVPDSRFLEVFVKATMETCRQRDPKGLYHRADAGLITQFTGISASYEEPVAPDLALDTECLSEAEAAELVLAHLSTRELTPVPRETSRASRFR